MPAQPLGRDLPNASITTKTEELSALQLLETILAHAEAPPCVIIDDSGDVLYVHGRVGRFLEPAEGKASLNILDMARPGLKTKLAAAIQEVAARNREITRENVRIQTDEGYVHVDVAVEPTIEQSGIRRAMIISFKERVSKKTTEKKEEKDTQAKGKKGLERDPIELERELVSTRENLQTTIEELEASNEELKSTNEELQSTNEELQSTNEELETSKEELQSLNEESASVNAELQGRVEELSKAYDDMKNLLDSTDIATIFLDSEINIRFFTPTVKKVIPLESTDVGRPLAHFATTVKTDDLVGIAKKVLKTLEKKEMEIDGKGGETYSMRVVPYRTVNNVIDGIVITFDDITERKKSEDALRISEENWRSMTQYSPDHLMLVDLEGTIRFINRTIPDLKADQLVGKNIYDFMPPEFRRAAADCFNQVVQTCEPADFENEFHTRKGRVLHFETRVGPVFKNGKVVGLTCSSRDITEKNHGIKREKSES